MMIPKEYYPYRLYNYESIDWKNIKYIQLIIKKKEKVH